MTEHIAIKRRDPRIIYRECQEIMTPYIAQIADVYAHSVGTMLPDGKGFCRVKYPTETEQLADSIRELMNAAVQSHLQESGYGTDAPKGVPDGD